MQCVAYHALVFTAKTADVAEERVLSYIRCDLSVELLDRCTRLVLQIDLQWRHMRSVGAKDKRMTRLTTIERRAVALASSSRPSPGTTGSVQKST